MRTTQAVAASIAAVALVPAGLAIANAGAANAYVANSDGSYAVSAAELQAAFGPSVNLAGVTFSLDGGDTVYLVSCQKTAGRSGHTIHHDFRRHSDTTWSVAATPVPVNGTIGYVTLVGSKVGETMTRVACPTAFTITNGTSPTAIGMTDVEVAATYNGVTVSLVDATPES